MPASVFCQVLFFVSVILSRKFFGVGQHVSVELVGRGGLLVLGIFFCVYFLFL